MSATQYRWEKGEEVHRYKILLQDGRELIVDGDRLEIVTEPRGSANRGDLLIIKGGHTVAHVMAGELAGYAEVEPDPGFKQLIQQPVINRVRLVLSYGTVR